MKGVRMTLVLSFKLFYVWSMKCVVVMTGRDFVWFWEKNTKEMLTAIHTHPIILYTSNKICLHTLASRRKRAYVYTCSRARANTHTQVHTQRIPDDVWFESTRNLPRQVGRANCPLSTRVMRNPPGKGSAEGSLLLLDGCQLVSRWRDSNTSSPQGRGTFSKLQTKSSISWVMARRRSLSQIY